MRKLLISTTALLTLLLLLIAAVSVYGTLTRQQLRTESSELALETTLEVFGSWDYQPVAERADDSLFEQSSLEFRRSRLNGIRDHGELETVESVSGDIETHSLWRPAAGASAHYLIELDFSSGTADIEIDLRLVDGRWVFSGYDIHSSLMAM